jgi:alanine racemase
MAVAKSNAYGHGLYDYAPAVERLGADWIGVDSIVEAVRLREIGIRKPVLVLGYTLPARFGDAAGYDISLTISSFENLEALGRSGLEGRVKVHLKMDTGLHRQGFLPGDVPKLVETLRTRLSGLEVEGVYTHFAQAKDPADREYTKLQVEAFEQATAALAAVGYRPLRHACATAGAFLYPGARYDMVRIGIGLIGLWPSPKTRSALEDRYELRPILTWRTIVSEVKSLPKGAGIGYDLTERLGRDSVVGICPVGYWHGFPRSLSRKGLVLVRGRRVRVLGSVAMDMIVIDLTDVPNAAPEDAVTLIGRDGNDEITAAEAAGRAGQSPYEFLTRLNPLIQKFYSPPLSAHSVSA